MSRKTSGFALLATLIQIVETLLPMLQLDCENLDSEHTVEIDNPTAHDEISRIKTSEFIL